MYDVLNRNGFVVALDQSSGSSEKTLFNYGIDKSRYDNEKEMLDLMHQMRKKIITNNYFNNDKIIGVILFKEEVLRKIDDEYTAEYLWNKKNILSFMKIDNGLADKKNEVQLMKEIVNLDSLLLIAREHNIFGTKMRSLIFKNNREGIRNVVKQQFQYAKKIWSYGLVPIIEPEIDINSLEKKECEITLMEEIDRELEKIGNIKIIFKFSLPEFDNFYKKYNSHKNVLKVMALSGGYDRRHACEKLSHNEGMIASFSKAFLQDLRENLSESQFNNVLKNSIFEIYEASIKGVKEDE